MGLGFGGMGGLMFTVVPIIISLGFLVVLGIFLFAAVRGVQVWSRNNHSPRLSVQAEVISRRTDISRHLHSHNGMGHTTTSTRYFVTFQVDSGDRMEFAVSGPEYGMLVEGDKGTLSFQGTRYLGFERR